MWLGLHWYSWRASAWGVEELEAPLGQTGCCSTSPLKARSTRPDPFWPEALNQPRMNRNSKIAHVIWDQLANQWCGISRRGAHGIRSGSSCSARCCGIGWTVHGPLICLSYSWPRLNWTLRIGENLGFWTWSDTRLPKPSPGCSCWYWQSWAGHSWWTEANVSISCPIKSTSSFASSDRRILR